MQACFENKPAYLTEKVENMAVLLKRHNSNFSLNSSNLDMMMYFYTKS